VTDLDGSEIVTDPAFEVQPDTTAPTVKNAAQSKDSIQQGTTVTLSANLSDNGALNTAILETNEDGTLKNRTTKPVSGQTATVSFDWQNKNVKAGTTVTWRIYATDAAGNVGKGTQKSFTVTEPEKFCPACPQATGWNKCAKSVQTRTAYFCDKSTNYQCQSKSEQQACIMAPADLAIEAVTAARTAVEIAVSQGLDVAKAQETLSEAEFAYASQDYATAQTKAAEAKALAEGAQPPTSPIYLIGAVLVVLAASIVAVFAKKGIIKLPSKKAAAPEAPETPAPLG
jgi:hypothetical protein